MGDGVGDSVGGRGWWGGGVSVGVTVFAVWQ